MSRRWRRIARTGHHASNQRPTAVKRARNPNWRISSFGGGTSGDTNEGPVGVAMSLNTTMTAERFGIGIYRPLGVVCLGSCGSSLIGDEVSAHG